MDCFLKLNPWILFREVTISKNVSINFSSGKFCHPILSSGKDLVLQKIRRRRQKGDLDGIA